MTDLHRFIRSELMESLLRDWKESRDVTASPLISSKNQENANRHCRIIYQEKDELLPCDPRCTLYQIVTCDSRSIPVICHAVKFHITFDVQLTCSNHI